MKDILIWRLLMKIYLRKFFHIYDPSSFKISVNILKLCVLVLSSIAIVQGLSPIAIKNRAFTNEYSELKAFPEFHPIKLILPLSSLREIKLQEEHKRIKKSTYGQSNKNVPAVEMRHKLKQLMANISNTFSDMDWYFSLEQLQNEALGETRQSCGMKKTKSNNFSKLKKDNEHSSDVFLDQFIRQMYEMNPVFIEKIRSRIDDEISSNKRRIRLAPASTRHLNLNRKNIQFPSNHFDSQRNSIVKSVSISNSISPSDELYYDDDKITEANENKDSSKENLNVNYYKGKQVYNIDGGDTCESFEFITTNGSSTTPEAFYDYGDYNKENYDYYYANEGIKNIDEYEINQDIVETSDSSTTDALSGEFRLAHCTLGRKNKLNRLKNKSAQKKKFV